MIMTDFVLLQRLSASGWGTNRRTQLRYLNHFLKVNPLMAILRWVIFLVVVTVTGCGVRFPEAMRDSSHLHYIDPEKTVALAKRYGFRGETGQNAYIWANGSGTKVMVQEVLDHEEANIYVFSQGIDLPAIVSQSPQHLVHLNDDGNVIAFRNARGNWHLLDGTDLHTPQLLTDSRGRFYIQERRDSKTRVGEFQNGTKQYILEGGNPSPDKIDSKNDHIYIFASNGEHGQWLSSKCYICDPVSGLLRITATVDVPGAVLLLDPWSDKVLITKEILPLTWGNWLFDLKTGSKVGTGDRGKVPLFLMDDWFDRRLVQPPAQ
jgi:hypothetical protein